MKAFGFILKMFSFQMDNQQVNLSFEPVAYLTRPEDIKDKTNNREGRKRLTPLPKQLCGDHVRLKHVLVSLTRHALRLSSDEFTKI
jgi:hypothetical protein